MKKKICICIPTKDRPEMVSEVLSYERSYYPDFDMDIVYFDSSLGDETRRVIEDNKAAGFNNLEYRKMPEDLCIDEKLFRILRDESDLLEYRYIWLINDSISIEENSLRNITEYADKNYDFIRLPVEGSGEKSDHETDDINDWFHNCSRGMAHMASTLMNTRLLEGEIDWSGLYDKYIVSNDLSDKRHGFFFTVGFYLERIAGLRSFCGLQIGNRRKWRRDSPLKKGRSYWDDLVFETWARSYPETILRIPDCYTGKEEVIRQSDNILFGRFERQSLISFRIRGLFSEDVCNEYRAFWQYVTTLKYDELLAISKTPVEELKEKYGENYGRINQWIDNLSVIEKDIEGRNIIIYGAGLYGEYVAMQLKEDGFADKVMGIAVTDAAKNVDLVAGIEVKNIDYYEAEKERAVVIIATLPDTAEVIKESLCHKGYRNIKLLF